MDTLDTRVIRSLFQSPANSPLTDNPRKSYRAIADSLDMDEGTLRNRLRKLSETGFLEGTRVLVHPDVLGIKLTQMFFDVPRAASKDPLIREIGLIPGVMITSNCFGNVIETMFFAEDGKSRQRIARLIAGISGARNLDRMDLEFPPCKITLSETDWKIAIGLYRKPRRPSSEIASELGISGKTVHRRIRRMVENGALYGTPVLNYRSMKGMIHADLVAYYSGREAKSKVDGRILARLDEYIVYSEVNSNKYCFLALHIPGISTAEEIQSWVKRERGLRRSRLALLHDRHEGYDGLLDLMTRRLEEIAKRN